MNYYSIFEILINDEFFCLGICVYILLLTVFFAVAAECHRHHHRPRPPGPPRPPGGGRPSRPGKPSDKGCQGSCPRKDPKHTSIYLKNKDCNKFCECSNGRAIVQNCPKGLHFNSRLDVCDWPWKAKC